MEHILKNCHQSHMLHNGTKINLTLKASKKKFSRAHVSTKYKVNILATKHTDFTKKN